MDSTEVNEFCETEGLAVRVSVFPFGGNAEFGISEEFRSERAVDAWVRAFKGELDDLADEIKRMMRARRAGGTPTR